ncbi:uncharacterized protein ARMOST_04697 [Armillaria ostoyae]|uniref:ABC transmembrane type-1 domain-containing protein n=1 Tax=Armillaria ostoyae TaxID=47428 RepID=A0A284QY22_ARMOS|nr:uncharacterized protein ARMOST_04697 [Armillaria ostoyae]
MVSSLRPSPAPPAFAGNCVLPEEDPPIFSRLIFQWLGPLLSVGFSRPLEKEDLWHLPQKYTTTSITDDVEINFYSRCPPEQRPFSLRHKFPSDIEHTWSPKESLGDVENTALDTEKVAVRTVYDSSLTKALHRIFFIRFWSAGICRLAGDTLRTTTPLVTKLLLAWLTASYEYYRLPDEQKASGVMDRPKGIQYGIGLGFAIFAMQATANVFTNHSMHLSMTTGLLLKSGIIGSIFRKSMRLSGRARLEHSVGKITNMISADASRLDRVCILWVAPIQIVIVVGLLFNNLGYSALVGFGILIFSFPMQVFVGRIMIELRKKSVKITDARVRGTTEALQGIRLIKFYAWEAFYSFQIGKLRQKEIRILKRATVARSALIATSTFIPILSSILSFITYGLTGHDLNIAIIFSSL